MTKAVGELGAQGIPHTMSSAAMSATACPEAIQGRRAKASRRRLSAWAQGTLRRIQAAADTA